MRVEENVSLSSMTTFRTGGPARFLLTVERKEEIEEAVRFAEEKKLPIIPWGEGSNMLPPDEGLNAVILRYLPSSVYEEKSEGGVVITAEAGMQWDALVDYAVSKGVWGLENLSAIPGTVGAAVVQNIGAYGAAVSMTLSRVEAYDTKTNALKTFSNDECHFGYRMSVFKEEPDRYLITAVSFSLSYRGTPDLSYRDLQIYFENNPSPSLLEVRNAVISIRAGKFPALSEYGTAGSFFLNPIFTEESVKKIQAKYPEMPVYPLPEGGVKIPLAWIFDQVLHAKGRSVGGAFIWQKQPLVIASHEHATSRDVALLAKSIVDDFLAETGISIAPEVRLFAEEKKIFS